MTAAQFVLARADEAYARGDHKGELLWLTLLIDSIQAVRCIAERNTAQLHSTALTLDQRPLAKGSAQSGDSHACDV